MSTFGFVQIRRRFPESTSLRDVFDAAATLGPLQPGQQFRLATGFPRRLLRLEEADGDARALEAGIEAGGCLIVVLDDC